MSLGKEVLDGRRCTFALRSSGVSAPMFRTDALREDPATRWRFVAAALLTLGDSFVGVDLEPLRVEEDVGRNGLRPTVGTSCICDVLVSIGLLHDQESARKTVQGDAGEASEQLIIELTQLLEVQGHLRETGESLDDVYRRCIDFQRQLLSVAALPQNVKQRAAGARRGVAKRDEGEVPTTAELQATRDELRERVQVLRQLHSDAPLPEVPSSRELLQLHSDWREAAVTLGRAAEGCEGALAGLTLQAAIEDDPLGEAASAACDALSQLRQLGDAASATRACVSEINAAASAARAAVDTPVSEDAAAVEEWVQALTGSHVR
eukprot:Hpha_TRINITY_DN3376_c0_g1::TRINITY_DN3376_c0_g1_i1::g.172314::m.172314